VTSLVHFHEPRLLGKRLSKFKLRAGAQFPSRIVVDLKACDIEVNWSLFLKTVIDRNGQRPVSSRGRTSVGSGIAGIRRASKSVRPALGNALEISS
jgi:hypothetical protein